MRQPTIPTTRDYVGTAVLNTIAALETDVRMRADHFQQRYDDLVQARDDYEAAREYAAADLVSEVLAGRAYASLLDAVVTRMIAKYDLHMPEWLAAHTGE
jgi:hypothetical protein